jgi:hypothetical protein
MIKNIQQMFVVMQCHMLCNMCSCGYQLINSHPARCGYIFLNWKYMPTVVRNVGAAILNTQLILDRHLTNIDASAGLSPRLGLLRAQARPEPTSSAHFKRPLQALIQVGPGLGLNGLGPVGSGLGAQPSTSLNTSILPSSHSVAEYNSLNSNVTQTKKKKKKPCFRFRPFCTETNRQ